MSPVRLPNFEGDKWETSAALAIFWDTSYNEHREGVAGKQSVLVNGRPPPANSLGLGWASCFVRVLFFREVASVTATIRKISRMVAHGVRSISLMQKRNYMQHISTPTEITRKSWQRTGDMLRASMERVGGSGVTRGTR